MVEHNTVGTLALKKRSDIRYMIDIRYSIMLLDFATRVTVQVVV